MSVRFCCLARSTAEALTCSAVWNSTGSPDIADFGTASMNSTKRIFLCGATLPAM